MKYILLLIFAFAIDIFSQGIIGTIKSELKYLKSEPVDELSKYTTYLTKGDVVRVDTVIFNTSGALWCKVSVKGDSGYLKLSDLQFDYETQIKVDSISKVRADEYKAWIVKINEQRRILKQEELVKEQKELKEKEKQLKERKDALTKKYGKKNAQRILDKKIWLGMSKEMAIESWGQPDDINRTVGSWGVHEQWIYVDEYLYFENGKLTSWQD